MRRRAFLAGLAGAVVGSSASVSAQTVPDRPSHITNVGDEIDELRKYQPFFVTTRGIRQRMRAFYGWYADSSEHSTRAYYYWMKYTHQEGWLESWTPWDTDRHMLDHEPVVVLTDRSTGDVERVFYSNYHHFVAELEGENANLQEYAVDGNETHVTLRIVPEHQHYTNYLTEDRGAPVENLTDIVSWLEARETWYDEGIFEKSNTEAVEDPFYVSEDTSSWWAEGTWDYRVGQWRYSLGLHDAENTDEGVRLRSLLPF
ncbi:hypothetical protein [Halomontanus rarus]|uniref:hypothetical protein n=1 Tax=Halomontanus rarus TaxID=3034020 RepID=UPI00307B76CC